MHRDCKEKEKVGTPIIIDDMYANRPARIYEDDAPTLRSDREGLKVGEPVDVYDAYNKKWIGNETCGTLTENSMGSTTHSGTFEVALPTLTPDRAEKRQNGRRFKENGEEMFTLTQQDIHGVGIDVWHELEEHGYPGIYVELSDNCTVYAVWNEKYECYIAVRKLTPKECFRLQGFTDDYFENAEFVNSNSQLYKQAGNAVSVPVVYDIAKKL